MNIALIGPSGGGKGTHIDKLVSKFDLLHLSTGDLLRENLENRTALGILARKYMDENELVPDELVDAMIEEWLWKAPPTKNILLDGFPRTRYQARFLDQLFEKMGRSLETAIYLKVSDEEIVKRLSGRLVCRNCQMPYHSEFNPPAKAGICDLCGGPLYHRSDDDPLTVRHRLKTFHRVTGPLIDYYQATGRLIIIEGEQGIDRVQNIIVEVVEAAQRHEQPLATREEIEQVRSLKGVITALSPAQATQAGLDLVLLGGPGSGKGTQAERLSYELGLQHIATGDLFRENLKKETELGKLAKTYMDRGELVPDDVTEAMVEERLSRPDTRQGFILDGFPRTLPQAEALTQMMTGMQRRLAGVLYIKVSDEEIVKRLSGRLICRECQVPFHQIFNPFKTCPYDKCHGEHLYQRDDDNPETVRARLKTFHEQTAPLIDYYRQTGLLIEIEGEGEVADVTDKVMAAVKKL